MNSQKLGGSSSPKTYPNRLVQDKGEKMKISNVLDSVRTLAFVVTVCGLFQLVSSTCHGQDTKQIENAFKIQPNQPGIDFDTPKSADYASCRLVRATEVYDVPGWIVYDNTGRIVRVFLDRDKNKKLDQWSYYKNGIEVYRDIDTDFDEKVDECRWMGSAGRRWGIDKNEDGVIDVWKAISAEEVAEEAFFAFKTKDRKRFIRLLLNTDELKQLQLGDKMNRVVAESVNSAAKAFDSVVAKQNQIGNSTKFIDFGGARPALVPEGREGIKQDLIIYDHAQSLFSTGEKFGQISLGTIVQVDDSWRVLEAPEMMSTSKPVTNGGLFFPLTASAPIASSDASPVNAKMTKMFESYEKLENQLRDARPGAATTKAEKERAELLVEMIKAHEKEEDRKNWTRQMADTVSSAYQQGLYPQGLTFLESYLKTQKSNREMTGLDYVEYRVIQARSHKGMQGNSRERAEANEKYMEDLEDYVKAFGKGEFAPDALMQLALYQEVSDDRNGQEQAIAWYHQVVDSFADSPVSAKAEGAIRRLGCIGKQIPFVAPTLVGNKRFDMRAYRGNRIVVLHFWATWCDACVDDFDELKRLQAKYKDELSVIGCNLDDDAEAVKRFLANKNLTWPQLWDEGGLEKSSLATQLGVATLPLTILIDKSGNVVENQIAVDDLDRDIQRAIRSSKSAGGAASADNRAGARSQKNR